MRDTQALPPGQDVTVGMGVVHDFPAHGQQCDDGPKACITKVTSGRVSRVTAQYPALSAEHIDLSDIEFWGWPLADRQAAFATLRALDHPPFYAEPEFIFDPGPGYYALVRHADVVEASRNPEVF